MARWGLQQSCLFLSTFFGIHKMPARRFSSLLCVYAYACDAQISLMANMHASIYNRTHTFAGGCAYLCRFGAEISRQYLLSNVCSLEEAQKPSVSDGAAERWQEKQPERVA